MQAGYFGYAHNCTVLCFVFDTDEGFASDASQAQHSQCHSLFSLGLRYVYTVYECVHCLGVYSTLCSAHCLRVYCTLYIAYEATVDCTVCMYVGYSVLVLSCPVDVPLHEFLLYLCACLHSLAGGVLRSH
eukprot:scpid109747/ scgid18039/ 